jgi:hypothetical protein
VVVTEALGGGGDLDERIVKFTSVLCHVNGVREPEGGIKYKECEHYNINEGRKWIFLIAGMTPKC